MTQTTYTPGPWRIGFTSRTGSQVIYAEQPGTGPVCSIEPNEGNARLIAASPDLLIALQMCREELAEALRVSDSNQQADNIDACMVAADSAIAKATGETK